MYIVQLNGGKNNKGIFQSTSFIARRAKIWNQNMYTERAAHTPKTNHKQQ